MYVCVGYQCVCVTVNVYVSVCVAVHRQLSAGRVLGHFLPASFEGIIGSYDDHACIL